MAVDLTKGFYFSLSYHLAATLQANYRAGVIAGVCECVTLTLDTCHLQ
jgi:hypothetical protein